MATSAFEQALLLGLYDDDRAKQIRRKGEPVAWRQVLAQVAALSARHATDGGARLRFLTDPTASPLLTDLRQRLLAKFPSAKFTSFSAVAGDGSTDGLRAAYGRAVEARHDLTRAGVIVSLDADFLGDGPEQLRLSRQYASHRVPGAGMNRLYVAEPALSVTGMNADHRLRLRAGDIASFAQAHRGRARWTRRFLAARQPWVAARQPPTRPPRQSGRAPSPPTWPPTAAVRW